MSTVLAGAAVGALAGGGLLLGLTSRPWRHRIPLDSRLAPYLRDSAPTSRLLAPAPTSPLQLLPRLLGPVLADLAHRLNRLSGGVGSVRSRLEQAGSTLTVEQFRMEQVTWAAAGLLGGLLVAVIGYARAGPVSALGGLLACAVGLVAGPLARDRALSRAVRRRRTKLLSEFPTVAEMLALAVASGEGPVGALERICRLTGGELAAEFGRALADLRSGTPLVAALDGVARRTSVPAIGRFVDGVAVAVERGTPLADVLRAQADDARESARRALLETGGRKEIGMLIPVVFLVLPVTVLFAVFPGFYGLSLSVP